MARHAGGRRFFKFHAIAKWVEVDFLDLKMGDVVKAYDYFPSNDRILGIKQNKYIESRVVDEDGNNVWVIASSPHKTPDGQLRVNTLY